MQRSNLPLGGIHDVYYSTDGTWSQVLTETTISKALGNDTVTAAAASKTDVLSGLKTAVLWCGAFWALVAIAVSLVL